MTVKEEFPQILISHVSIHSQQLFRYLKPSPKLLKTSEHVSGFYPRSVLVPGQTRDL